MRLEFLVRGDAVKGIRFWVMANYANGCHLPRPLLSEYLRHYLALSFLPTSTEQLLSCCTYIADTHYYYTVVAAAVTIHATAFLAATLH